MGAPEYGELLAPKSAGTRPNLSFGCNINTN